VIPETIFGIPAHPLIVHAVVVLGPLSALGLIVVVLVPRWRRAYAPLVAQGTIAATVSAIAAAIAGGALEESLGASGVLLEKIEAHESIAMTVPIILLVQTVLAVAVVLLDRRDAARGLVLAVSIGAVVVSGVAIVQIVRAGHAGSEAVWNPTG